MSQVSKNKKDKVKNSISKVKSKESSKQKNSKSPASKKSLMSTSKKNTELPLKEDTNKFKKEEVYNVEDDDDQNDDYDNEVDELESASEMRNAEIVLTSHTLKPGKVYFKYNLGGIAKKK